MEQQFGYIRWAKLTAYKNGVVKPRVTIDILTGKVNGVYQTIRLGFEAPDGEGLNQMTKKGIEGVAIDPTAFTGLTPGMIRVDGEAEFIKFVDRSPVKVPYKDATQAEQKLYIDARVNLNSLMKNIRQAQMKNEVGDYVPMEDKQCTVKLDDVEYPAVRRYRSLVRGGSLEIASMGSFRADSNKAIKL